MKKYIVFMMILLLCASVSASVIHGKVEDQLGGFSGDGGSNQDDSVIASLDLAHIDLDAIIAYNEAYVTLMLSTGQTIYYVDSGAGAGTGTGLSWTNASETLDAAIVLAQAATLADTGSLIFVAAGHAEGLTGANDVDMDTAGMKIIGLGVGENRPTFTYTTSGEWSIAADDCEIHNMVFIAGAAVANAIDVEAAMENFVINNCRFAVTSLDSDEFTDCIIVAAGADNGRITNCRFEMGGAQAASAINLDGADFLEISDNIITGDYSAGCIEDAEGTASIWVIIRDNIITNGTGGTLGLNAVECITLKSDSTAIIADNHLFSATTKALAVIAADGFLVNNTFNTTEGNVLEPGKTYVRTFIMPGATDDDLFLVAGGNILITSLTGYVTTSIGAQCTISIIMNHADQDFEFTTAADIATAVDGGTIIFTAASPPVPTVRAIGSSDEGADSPMNPWHCPPGMIALLDSDGGTAGVIEWSMVFIPLDEGVTVTAQ